MSNWIAVPLDDLRRFVERAKWTPPMLDTLDADEYRLTVEAGLRLRWIIQNGSPYPLLARFNEPASSNHSARRKEARKQTKANARK